MFLSFRVSLVVLFIIHDIALNCNAEFIKNCMADSCVLARFSVYS